MSFGTGTVYGALAHLGGGLPLRGIVVVIPVRLNGIVDGGDAGTH